ncbi:phage baseplate assembly protein V [Foetidibacter luteolus]|uniref:phage baseplate assembly protein V n=1 Tax=Foetidibacter luteolus TaxID=2608880 RepID=UPI00129BB7C0|nr:phage baseplate assembly protein V [Foetidibacter luteolus]
MTCLKYGLVSEVKPGFAKVSFIEDEFVTDWMPVIVRKTKTDKESWQLEINEHVVCLMLHDCDEGVILGAIVNDEDTPDPGEGAGKFRKLFSDGTFIKYDKAAHELTVDVKGDLKAVTTGKVEIRAGGKADVQAAGDITAQTPTKATIQAPVINLTGNVVVSGSLQAAAISAIASGGFDGKITSNANIETTGEIKGADIKAGAISLLTHKHGGVQTGAGLTGTPV